RASDVSTGVLQSAELGVGDQHSFIEKRGSDACSQGGHDDEPTCVACRPVMELANPCGVGVVDHRDRTTELVAQQLSCVTAAPGRADVGCRAHHAVGHHGWHGHADGRVAGVVGEMCCDLRDDVDDGGG